MLSSRSVSGLCSRYRGFSPFCAARLRRSLLGGAAATAPVTEQASTSGQPADAHPVQSKSYPFPEIEKKWQQFWDANKTFRTPDDLDMTKPKHYVLDMFPYPR